MLFTCFSCLTPYLYPHSLFLTLYPLSFIPLSSCFSYRYCLPKLTLRFCLPRVPSDATSPSQLPLSFITRLPPPPSRHNDVDAAFAYDGPFLWSIPFTFTWGEPGRDVLGNGRKSIPIVLFTDYLCCLPFGPFLNFSCRTLIRSWLTLVDSGPFGQCSSSILISNLTLPVLGTFSCVLSMIYNHTFVVVISSDS